MTRKIVVAVAPTGGSHMKADNPFCPTQPEEIAATVAECAKIGASMAYLHVRTETDAPCCYPEIYRRTNALVRERCNVVINNSSGGGMAGDMITEVRPGEWQVKFEERIKAFEADPDTITIDTCTMMIPLKTREVLFKTTVAQGAELLAAAKKNKLKPELMAFDPSGIARDVTRLIQEGYDEPPFMVNITTDYPCPQGMPYTPESLNYMVGLLPKDNLKFTITGMGSRAWDAIAQGIILGASGVRIGIEDTPYDNEGKPVTNLDLVRRAVALIKQLGHEPATGDEARAMYGLPAR